MPKIYIVDVCVFFSAHQPVTTLSKASKILQGQINLVPAILNYALNFSIADKEVDAKDFQIIYQYLQDNHEEQLEPFVFKHTLTPISYISKLADSLHEQYWADNFEISCGFSDDDQPTIEISVYKKMPLVERLKQALSKYTSLQVLEIKNISEMLDLITKESNIVPGEIDCNQIMLHKALNFSSKFTKLDANDFQIIFQHLKDNLEEQLGPFVFKNTLTPKSYIPKLVDTLNDNLAKNYHLVYGFSDGDPFSTEISVCKDDSLLERFKHFFESIPTGSGVAIVTRGYFHDDIFAFFKILARLLEREMPIDATSLNYWSSASKVNSWLSSDGQQSRDLVTYSEDFGTKKTKFVIELSSGSSPKLAENATSKYTFIQISFWDAGLFVVILESMEEQQYTVILSRVMSQVGKDPLCVQTLIGT